MKKIAIAAIVLLALATFAVLVMNHYSGKATLNPISKWHDNAPDSRESAGQATSTQEVGGEDNTQNIPALQGTSWQWVSMTDANGNVVRPDRPERFVLTFGADGRFNSTTDCNSMSGAYIQDSEVLSMGQIAVTLMACMEPTWETEYGQALGQVASHQIEGDTMTMILLKDQGKMTFVRK